MNDEWGCAPFVIFHFRDYHFLMKRILSFFKYSLLFLLTIFLLRGWLFRKTVNYHAIGELSGYAVTDPSFRQYLENQRIDTIVVKIIRRSLNLTATHLRFTTGKSDIDPNLLFYSKNAHCVGYAAFFSTTCNELLRQAGLDERFEVKHLRGKISFLGIDLHQFFNGPFFRDHDFNEILDKTTGQRFYVDASVQDVFGIVYVKEE